MNEIGSNSSGINVLNGEIYRAQSWFDWLASVQPGLKNNSIK